MSDKAAAIANSNEDEGDEDGEEEEIAEAPRNGRGSARVDPFDVASKAATDELEGNEKPAAKPKAKKPEEKPASKPEKKEAPKATQKPADGDDDEGEPDTGDAPKAAATPAQAPATAKSYWSRERRESFDYQPKSVQEAWLAEEPAPNNHWTTEQKTTFARQPRDVKEAWLEQSLALERGFGQRFESLAGERKLADGIRQAVPQEIRAVMANKNLDEVAVFSKLLGYQQQAMKDPTGYIRSFMQANGIDPSSLGASAADGQDSSHAPKQADVESHPAYQAMRAEVEQLKAHVTNEIKQRTEQKNSQIESDVTGFLGSRNAEGDLLYPFARVLQGAMADVITSDPGRYGSMGVKERCHEAYTLALETYPELKQISRTAKTAPVDEPEDEDADTEEEAQAARLKKATTKKTRTPQSVPTSGRSGDAFDRASAAASKSLGY